MIHGVTGHRTVEQQPGELSQFARLSVAQMRYEGATEIITGMARGWDLAVAEACIELDVPFCAAIPFPQQSHDWSDQDRHRWHAVMLSASRVPPPMGKFRDKRFFKQRNVWIVDNCVRLWSLHQPGQRGGTEHCVLYAGDAKRIVTPLWDDWLKFRDERKRHARI